mgnify:CR=1 FL=1
MDPPQGSLQWSLQWTRKVSSMAKHISKTITLTLTPSTVSMANDLLLRLLVGGDDAVREGDLFKSGEKVVVSWTKDHIRGFGLTNNDKRLVGDLREDMAAASLFMVVQAAVAKGAPVSFINQSLFHVQVERFGVVGEDGEVIRHDYVVDSDFSMPYLSLQKCKAHPTGVEMYVFNKKWKAKYGGKLHYDGEALKAQYPEQWAEAAQIAQACV